MSLRIIEVMEDDHSFELNIDNLEKILLNPAIADKKVSIIGVAGAYRKGKSFLLNFFLRFLNFRTTEHDDLLIDKWLDSLAPLEGFSWRGGSELETNGILIWSEPFILKDRNNEDVVVILMDTQGAFDSQSTVRDCATIFALSTMITSVQIYNLSQNIQEDDLQHLQLFTEYGRLALESSENKPFQSLMFLVRDWQYPYEAEYGFQGGQNLLDKRLKLSENPHSELLQLRTHIRSCFENISCFLMPHPGLKVATNPSFNGTLTDIEEEFAQQLRLMVPRLLDPDNLVVKEINGQKVTCRALVEYFKAYMKVFQGQALPEPKSVLLATAEANNLAALASAKALYQRKMEEVCGGETPYLNTEALNEEHVAAKAAAVREFRNARKMGGVDYSLTFLKELEEYIAETFENYVKVNNGKRLMLLATAKANNLAALASAKALYQSKMEEVCGGETPYLNTEALNEEHDAAKAAAVREFKNARKTGGVVLIELKNLKLECLEELKEYIAERYKFYVKVNNEKKSFKSVLRIAKQQIAQHLPTIKTAVLGVATVVGTTIATIAFIIIKVKV